MPIVRMTLSPAENPNFSHSWGKKLLIDEYRRKAQELEIINHILDRNFMDTRGILYAILLSCLYFQSSGKPAITLRDDFMGEFCPFFSFSTGIDSVPSLCQNEYKAFQKKD